MKNNNQELERDDKGSPIMNEYNLAILCVKDDLYDIPDLNSKLYLHFKGFRKISGLQQYKNLKTLWLENNLITKIEGLDALTQLANLYLHNNLIDQIEGLDSNIQLVQLNLSSNSIKFVSGLSHLDRLVNLNLSSNKIESSSSLVELIQNNSLSTLDLQNNFLKLEQVVEKRESGTEIDLLLHILMQMNDIRCIYLMNNEYIRACNNYRKIYVGLISSLTYLDQKPITLRERQLAEAFVRDGKEGELKQKQLFLDQETMLKIQQSEEIKKTIPKHIINKISLFERTYYELLNEISQLEQVRTIKICDGFSVEYLNEELQRKQSASENTLVLINVMRKRLGKDQFDLSEYNSSSQASDQKSQQSVDSFEIGINLDELD